MLIVVAKIQNIRVTCSRKICNVCSQSCLPSEIGYSEENHTIGKCGDCVNEAVELFEEEVMVSKQKTTFKKKDGRQLKLDFFTKKTGANDRNSAASGEKSQEKTKDSSIPDNQKSIFKTAASNVVNKNTKKNISTTRGLTLVTAEKWKSTHLVLFDPDQWLIINADKKGNVQSL